MPPWPSLLSISSWFGLGHDLRIVFSGSWPQGHEVEPHIEALCPSHSTLSVSLSHKLWFQENRSNSCTKTVWISDKLHISLPFYWTQTNILWQLRQIFSKTNLHKSFLIQWWWSNIETHRDCSVPPHDRLVSFYQILLLVSTPGQFHCPGHSMIPYRAGDRDYFFRIANIMVSVYK